MYRIYIDCETISSTPINPGDIQVPTNYKDSAKIEQYQRQRADEQFRKQALDSMQGIVLCIGCAQDEKEPICFYNMDSDSEYLILLEFENWIDKFPLNGFYWIGHNIKTFDLQFLWRKAVKYRLPRLGCHIPRHPYAQTIQDTQSLWAGTDTRNFTKLDDIAQFLDIGGKNGIDGSQIYDYWIAGKHEKIVDYCKQDIEITRSVFKAINFEL